MDARHFDRELLRAISRVQQGFLATSDAGVAFNDLLAVLLELTGSAYGFVGEVLRDAAGAPFLKIRAMTDISWDAASRRVVAESAADGLEFRNLNTLFGAVMTTGRAVLTNQPASDPRSGGLPAGHPGMAAFMGLPFGRGDEMNGMVGVANRAGGYDEALAAGLEPLLATCASLVEAHRARRAERAALQAARRSEERLRLALAAGRFGTIEQDFATGRITMDTIARATFGFDVGSSNPVTPEALLGNVHPDDLASAIERMGSASHDNGLASRFEARVVHPDGSIRWLATWRVVLRDDAGAQIESIAIVQDVTEEHERATRLMQTDRMVTVGTLAAGVGHEINNPLAYVVGNLKLAVELLADQAPLSPARLGALGAMLGDALVGGDRIAAIVRQLREFSRDDGQVRPLALADVVRSAAAMAGNQIRHRARLVLDLAPVPLLHGQSGPLAQVVLNLLVNAAQAIEAGAAEANEIRVALAPDGQGRVVLTVTDSGCGIAPEVLPRIFDPFFTTKDVGEGTGLGLSVSRQIVVDHGGELRVTSTPGRGTSVAMILPERGRQPRESASVELEATPLPAAAVLVIDDDPMVGRLLPRLLGDQVASVVVASVAAARAALAAGSFDVILCDLMMPDETGMALHVELARSQPILARRFVFMTGGTFTSEARRFVAATAQPVLDKPLDLDRLGAAMRTVMAR